MYHDSLTAEGGNKALDYSLSISMHIELNVLKSRASNLIVNRKMNYTTYLKRHFRQGTTADIVEEFLYFFQGSHE